MPCFRPVQCWQPLDGGAVSFSEKKNHREIQIACGRCIGCRIEKRDAWAVRIMHESKMHARNSFITLTYDDEHCPSDGGLNYGHCQLFLKRLRSRLRRLGLPPFRFFLAGEYGDQFNRPHYHAIIFGHDFAFDRVKCNSLYSKSDIYTSPTLSACWQDGFHSIGGVSWQSARYVASYVIKRANGALAAERYARVNCVTGEISQVPPEFAHMSLKPGIGFSFFEKYCKEMLDWDQVIVDGRPVPLPRYYDKLIKDVVPFRGEELAYERFVKSRPEESTRERLAVREQVAIAKDRFYSER